MMEIMERIDRIGGEIEDIKSELVEIRERLAKVEESVEWIGKVLKFSLGFAVGLIISVTPFLI